MSDTQTEGAATVAGPSHARRTRNLLVVPAALVERETVPALVWVAGSALGVVGLVGFAVVELTKRPALAIGLLLAAPFLLLVLLVVHFVRSQRPLRGRAGQLEITPQGVALAGERLADRGSVRQLTLSGSAPAVLTIDRGPFARLLRVSVASRRDGLTIAKVLGIPPRGDLGADERELLREPIVALSWRHYRARKASVAGLIPAAMALAAAVTLANQQSLALSLAFGLLSALVAAAALIAFVSYGALVLNRESIVVSWWWFRRVVPIADVETVGAGETTINRYVASWIQVRARSGSDLVVILNDCLASPREVKGWTAAERARASSLAERLREHLAAWQQKARESSLPAVPQGGQDPIRWIAELRRGAEHDGYRVAPPIEPDELWRLLECEEAEPWSRAAACIALGVQLDDLERARIRALSMETSIVALAEVCRAVAEGDERLLVRGVRALPAPRGTRARARTGAG